MAEFLIYNKTNWREDPVTGQTMAEGWITDKYLVLEQRIKSLYIQQMKYDARYRKGDIIEIHEDGFWTDGKREGWGAPDFALVCVPGMSLAQAKGMERALFHADGSLLRKSQYWMDTKKLSFTNSKASVSHIEDAHLKDKELTVGSS